MHAFRDRYGNVTGLELRGQAQDYWTGDVPYRRNAAQLRERVCASTWWTGAIMPTTVHLIAVDGPDGRLAAVALCHRDPAIRVQNGVVVATAAGVSIVDFDALPRFIEAVLSDMRPHPRLQQQQPKNSRAMMTRARRVRGLIPLMRSGVGGPTRGCPTMLRSGTVRNRSRAARTSRRASSRRVHRRRRCCGDRGRPRGNRCAAIGPIHGLSRRRMR